MLVSRDIELKLFYLLVSILQTALRPRSDYHCLLLPFNPMVSALVLEHKRLQVCENEIYRVK